MTEPSDTLDFVELPEDAEDKTFLVGLDDSYSERYAKVIADRLDEYYDEAEVLLVSTERIEADVPLLVGAVHENGDRDRLNVQRAAIDDLKEVTDG